AAYWPPPALSYVIRAEVLKGEPMLRRVDGVQLAHVAMLVGGLTSDRGSRFRSAVLEESGEEHAVRRIEGDVEERGHDRGDALHREERGVRAATESRARADEAGAHLRLVGV